MTPRAGEPLSTAVSSIVAQYETLRAAALGDVLAFGGPQRADGVPASWHVGLGAPSV